MADVTKKVLKKIVKKVVKKKTIPKKTLKKLQVKEAAKKIVKKVVKKVVKTVTTKPEKNSSLAKERRLFAASLLTKSCYTDKEIEDIVKKKHPEYIKASYVSGVRWELNRGNLGLTKPQMPIERIVEFNGKKMTLSKKKELMEVKKVKKEK